MVVDERPRFLITVDTEGDNLWSRPRRITTRNAEFLPRFQALCEAHGLRATYLVTYEMANAPEFQSFGRDVLRRGVAEIGMHLHAWNTPPDYPLTLDDLSSQPYLIEYPEPVMRQKIFSMTAHLEEVFGVKMVSHRAGRWAFNPTYARLLVEHGYRVDCSVTPHVSWQAHDGGMPGRGGTDYSRFPADAYCVDLDDIARPGSSPLLEVPMTVVPSAFPALDGVLHRLGRRSLVRRAVRRYLPAVRWLRPDRRNRDAMVGIVRRAARERRRHVEFMVHSSELMPGGSPLFRTANDIEALYRDLGVLFEIAGRLCLGATLGEYYDAHLGRTRVAR